MSNLNSFYNNYPDDNITKKRKKKKVYSSNEFVPGIAGALIKLLVCFIIYFLSTSLITVIFTSFMYLKEMYYIIIVSVTMMMLVWSSSYIFKVKSNLHKLLMPIFFLVLFYIISPYSILVTIILTVYNFAVILIANNKMNLPEKIALSPAFILTSCFFFCVYQIIFSMTQFKVDSALEARPIYMVIGIAWIFLCIFILNVINVKRKSYKNKASKGLMVGNIIGTLFFSALVFVIASIGAYKEFITNTIVKFLVLLMGKTKEVAPITESVVAENKQESITEIMGQGKESFFWNYMEKVLIVFAVVLILVMLFLITRMLFRKIKNSLSTLFSFLRDNDTASKIIAFKDKEESVFDKNQISVDFKNRFNNILKSFKRKAKYKDMKNNRQRMRFIYKTILTNDMKESSKAKYKTAKELLLDDDDKINSEIFVAGYEKARYSEHDIADSEVDAGLRITGINK